MRNGQAQGVVSKMKCHWWLPRVQIQSERTCAILTGPALDEATQSHEKQAQQALP